MYSKDQLTSPIFYSIIYVDQAVLTSIQLVITFIGSKAFSLLLFLPVYLLTLVLCVNYTLSYHCFGFIVSVFS